MKCEVIKELIPGYVLGVLEPEESLYVEEHLAECAQCHREGEALQPVVSRLAFAAEIREPRPELRERVLRAVELAGTPAREPVIRQPERRLVLRPIWVLAAATVIAGLLIWNLFLQVQVARQRDQLSEQARLMTVLALAEEPPIVLQGTEVAPAALARLVIDPDHHGGALIVKNMPDLAPGRVYQLWLIRPNGTRDNGGTFTVSDGQGMIYFHMPAAFDMYQAVDVTDEPAGGSPGPTGTKVLRGNL